MDNFDTVLVINRVSVAKSEMVHFPLRIDENQCNFLKSVFVKFISDALYKIIAIYQEKKKQHEHKHHVDDT